jgi:alpha-tubulin suppressor-like RCC1 family protein
MEEVRRCLVGSENLVIIVFRTDPSFKIIKGEHGQLGQGPNDRVNKLTPTLVKALENEFISQAACGWSHTVALTAGGAVYV